MYSDMPRKCYETIDSKIDSFSQLILKKVSNGSFHIIISKFKI